jgi:LuxR family maltose regulon positive regulatory protein
MAGAWESIWQAEEIAAAYQSVPGFRDPIAACRARLLLIQARASGGDLGTVEQWAEKRNLRIDGPINSLLAEVEYLTWARLLILKKPERAWQLLARLLTEAEAGERTGRVIEILALQTLARQSLGHTDQAFATIERALTLAEPAGYIRLFIDEGPPMARLLRRMNASREGGSVNSYIEKLLAAFDTSEAYRAPLHYGQQEEQADLFPAPHPLVEPLSERELEVLLLIARGLTNQAIAETLVVALGTVKAHTASIYGKLEVHSRTQAVARARELDLL